MARSTQLARVQTSTPRLLALVNTDANTNTKTKTNTKTNANANANNAVRVVVQIRPTLLHYVQDGMLMCVITSQEEICGVTQCDSLLATAVQVIVATTSGSVWLVRLPATPMGVKPIVLRTSDTHTSSDAVVRCIADMPGAQHLVYLASLDLLVCSSLLVPTTLVGGLLEASSTQWRLEVDDLEGERSTSLYVVATGSQTDHPRLASWLLGDMPGTSTRILSLQGDTDGSVRCATVDAGPQRLVERVRELVRLSEPIHALLPVRLEKGTGADALLVVGSRGSIALLSRGITHTSILFGRVGTAVTSVAFVDADEATIAFSTIANKIITLSMAQLLTRLDADARASCKLKTLASYSTELSQCKDVLMVCAHTSATSSLSLLTRSGRLVTMARDDVYQSPTQANTTEASTTDLRVKTLLQDISRLSQKTDTLRETSERADELLYGTNTALQLVRHVEQHGIASVLVCSSRLKLVDNGWAMQSKGVHLLFEIRFKNLLPPAQFMPSAMWRLQLTVGSSASDRVASYGFSLHECIGNEQCIELDESVLEQRDGVVHVSCELLFSPRITTADSTSQLASFGIPVLQSKEFHLVQLSEPTRDFPMNPAAVRERFTVLGHLGSPARHGHQWRRTLFEDASAAGIALSTHEADDVSFKAVPPPLRVVTRILSGRAASEVGSPLTEQDAMALVYRIMNAESEIERLRWRSASRHINGKWWLGMHTFSGNLIVLRLATTTITSTVSGSGGVTSSIEDCVEITVHASNAADLAAMRALLLLTCVVSDKKDTEWKKQGLERASLALMNTRAELTTLSATISDIHQKTTTAAISGRRDDQPEAVNLCQDELLQLLRRTGQVETQTLEIYWKVREVLSQHLTL